MLCKDLIEHLCTVVEGETEMAELALLLQLPQTLKRTELLEIFKVLLAHSMYKVEIEILLLCLGELLVKQPVHIGKFLDIPHRQLVREKIAVARIFRQRLAEKQLRFSVVISVGGVKIVYAALVRTVDHRFCFASRDLAVLVCRESHPSEAQQ